MATGMHMDERSVDCLVLGHHDQDRKVSAKSVTMRAMTLCKNLSGYRELLLRFISNSIQTNHAFSCAQTEDCKKNNKAQHLQSGLWIRKSNIY